MLELLLLVLLAPQSDKAFEVPPKNTRPMSISIDLAEVPAKNNKTSPKLVNEERVAILAKDVRSNKTLFSKSENRHQNIASLTKLMTFLLIYEHHDLDEIVTISPSATRTYGAKIDLYAYERVSVRFLLRAILIPSANDAAKALAIFDAGSEADFVTKMNEKARTLGLTSAKFYNASGLDIEKTCSASETDCVDMVYGNKMSAKDLLQLTRLLLKNDFFRETIQQKVFQGTSEDGSFFHEKVTTNQLLSNDINSKGVKTGYTELAGQCFIDLSETVNGHEVLTVILGSSDRFGETRTLVEWIMDNFEWR